MYRERVNIILVYGSKPTKHVFSFTIKYIVYPAVRSFSQTVYPAVRSFSRRPNCLLEHFIFSPRVGVSRRKDMHSH